MSKFKLSVSAQLQQRELDGVAWCCQWQGAVHIEFPVYFPASREFGGTIEVWHAGQILGWIVGL